MMGSGHEYHKNNLETSTIQGTYRHALCWNGHQLNFHADNVIDYGATKWISFEERRSTQVSKEVNRCIDFPRSLQGLILP